MHGIVISSRLELRPGGGGGADASAANACTGGPAPRTPPTHPARTGPGTRACLLPLLLLGRERVVHVLDDNGAVRADDAVDGVGRELEDGLWG